MNSLLNSQLTVKPRLSLAFVFELEVGISVIGIDFESSLLSYSFISGLFHLS